MKTQTIVTCLLMITALSGTALAENCQQTAEAAALREFHQQFASSGGRTSVDSVSIQGNTAAVMLDNQNVSDVPEEVDVPIQQTGNGGCRVTGPAQFVGGDNS